MNIKTQPISFCNKSAINIINSDAKQLIMDSLSENYGINMKHKYANLLNKNSMQYLSKQPHLISIKTGGSNYFLYLTKLDDINTCLFIDRKVKQGYTLPRIISAKFRFSDDLFNGTLLDGELVRDNENNWMFLLSNLLVYKGTSVEKNIVWKYNTMYDMLTNEYTKDPVLDICYLFVKRLFKYNEYSKMITMYIPNLKYNIRGIYFNTLNTKHCNHLFMYPRNMNSTAVPFNKQTTKNVNNSVMLDKNFLLRKTEQPDIYHLYIMKDNAIAYYNVALIQKLKTSKIIKKWFTENEKNEKNETIVKCNFNSKFKKWEVQELNPDAKVPSNYIDIIKYEK